MCIPLPTFTAYWSLFLFAHQLIWSTGYAYHYVFLFAGESRRTEAKNRIMLEVQCYMMEKVHTHNTFLHVHIMKYICVGHRNVRELIKRKSTSDTPITFRKKRVPSMTENRTPQIKLSDCTTGSATVHQCSTSTPGSGTGSSISRGVKRRATGLTVPPRKVLQLHNYFSKVDSK